MSSSDEEQRQYAREREVLGDEIERMRQLLGGDFAASDEESSGEEEEQGDSEEGGTDDFNTGRSSSYLRQHDLHSRTPEISQDHGQCSLTVLERSQPTPEVDVIPDGQHEAGLTPHISATDAHPCHDFSDRSEPYTLTELKPANNGEAVGASVPPTGQYTRLLQFVLPEHQGSLSTQAEQPFVQKFGPAELPIEPSFISEDDHWEEGSTEKMLSLNREYQVVIMNELKKVELALIKNREQRTSMVEARSRQSRAKRESMSDPRAESQSLRRFAAPYFKDDSGHGPPDNEDARLRRSKSQISAYQVPSKLWTQQDQDLLAEGVRLQNYEHRLAPLMQRLRELKNQHHVTKLEQGEVDQLEQDIAAMRAMPKKEFEFELEGIDWDKLSATLLPKRSAFECQLQWCHFGHPRVNKRNWTKREDKQLMQLARTFNNREWNQVAEKIQTNRTPFQCLQRFQRSLNRDFLKSKWTPEEDERLKEVVRVWGGGDWQRVAGFMEGRTGDQCAHRYQKTLRSDIKRGKWSEEEDQCLLKAVEKFGARSWYRMSDLVPGRTGVQCRERYVNVLDPTIKRGKGSWTQDEDERFLGLIEKYGEGSWAKIARELGDRTDNQCWRRWMVLRQMDFIHYKVNTLRKKKELVANFSGRGFDRPTITEKDLDIPDLPVQKPRIGRPPRPPNPPDPSVAKTPSPLPTMALAGVPEQDDSSGAHKDKPGDHPLDSDQGGRSSDESGDGPGVSDDDDYRPSRRLSLATKRPAGDTQRQAGPVRRAAAVRAGQRLAAVISGAEPAVAMETGGNRAGTEMRVETEITRTEKAKNPSARKSLDRRKQGGRRDRVQSHHRNLMNKWQLEKRKAIVQMQRKSPNSAAGGGGVAVAGTLAPFSLLLQAFSVNVPAVMQSLQKAQPKDASQSALVGQQSSAPLHAPQQPLSERPEPAVTTGQRPVVKTTPPGSSADKAAVTTEPTMPSRQQSGVQTQTSELHPRPRQRSSAESTDPVVSTNQKTSNESTEPVVSTGQQSSAASTEPTISTNQKTSNESSEPAVSTRQQSSAESTEPVVSTNQKTSNKSTEPAVSTRQQSSAESTEPVVSTNQKTSNESTDPAVSTRQQSSAARPEPTILPCQHSPPSLAEEPSEKNRQRSSRKDALQKRVDSLIRKNDEVVRTAGEPGASAAMPSSRAPCVPRLPPCHSTLIGLHTLRALKPQLEQLASSRPNPRNEQRPGTDSTQESGDNGNNTASGACQSTAGAAVIPRTGGASYRASPAYKLLAERFRSLFLWPSLLSKVPLIGPVPKNFLRKARPAPAQPGSVSKRRAQRRKVAKATTSHTGTSSRTTSAAVGQNASARETRRAATIAGGVRTGRCGEVRREEPRIRRQERRPPGASTHSSRQVNSHSTERAENYGELPRHDSPGTSETRTAPEQPTGQVSETRTAPEQPTRQASETRTAPEQPAGQASETRTAPEQPTRQAIETRTAPEQPAGQASETRTAPEQPTRQASETRTAPEQPARKASETRTAPEQPARQASETRTAPEQPTRQAIETRTAPKQPTGQAIETRTAPEQPTGQASETRTAPKQPARQASETRTAPEQPTEQASETRTAPEQPTKQASETRTAPKQPARQASETRTAPEQPTKQASETRAAPKQPARQASETRTASEQPTEQASETRTASEQPTEQASETRTASEQPTGQSSGSSVLSRAEDHGIRTCGQPDTWCSSGPRGARGLSGTGSEQKGDALKSSRGEAARESPNIIKDSHTPGASNETAAQRRVSRNQEQGLGHAHSDQVGLSGLAPSPSEAQRSTLARVGLVCTVARDSADQKGVAKSSVLLITVDREGIVRASAQDSAVSSASGQAPVIADHVGTRGQMRMRPSVERGAEPGCQSTPESDTDRSDSIQTNECRGETTTLGRPASSKVAPQDGAAPEAGQAMPVDLSSSSTAARVSPSPEPVINVPSAGQPPVSEVMRSATGTQALRKRPAPWPQSTEDERPKKELKENTQVNGLPAAGHVTSPGVTPRRKRKYLPTVPARRGTGNAS